MKKIALLTSILIMIIGLSCKDKIASSNENMTSLKSMDECFRKEDKERIIYKILNTDYIEKHLDPRVKNLQIPIKLLKNEFITDNLHIESHGNTIILIDSINLSDDTFRIRFFDIDCTNKKLGFVVTYPVEGNWFGKGFVSDNGNTWEANITAGGIAD